MSIFSSDELDRSALRLLLGKELGIGSTRKVYAIAFDPSKVIKIEEGAGTFANVQEHLTWELVKGTRWAKWFAPVHAIDPWSAGLIQTRTTPLTVDQWAGVERLPNFFEDLKRQNFGMLDGRVVAHDYALNDINSVGLIHAKVRSIRSFKSDEGTPQ